MVRLDGYRDDKRSGEGGALSLIDASAIAAILVESHSDLIIDEIDLPDELGYVQVLIRVLYSGICAPQVHEIDALKGPDAYLPHLLGHEGSGSVLGVGKGVTTVAPGDNVVMRLASGCRNSG